jgi:hypothetical protein
MRNVLLLMMLAWPARADGPDARLEWLVVAKGKVSRPALLGAFDEKWRREHDLVRLYGWHGDQAVAVLEDGGESYDQVAAAMRLLTPAGDDELRTVTVAILKQFREDASARLKQARAGQPTAPATVEEGAAASRKLQQLFEANGTEVQLRLLTNTPWAGPRVLEVLPQNESGFVIKTRTPPGKLEPEALKSGKMNPTSLIFELYVPHAADPKAAFERMVKAHALAAKKLGGIAGVEVETFGKHQETDVKTARKRVAEVEKALARAGFPAGSPAALKLFYLP